MKTAQEKKQEIKDLIIAREEHQRIIEETIRETHGRAGKQFQIEFQRLRARWRLDMIMQARILRLIDEL